MNKKLIRTIDKVQILNIYLVSTLDYPIISKILFALSVFIFIFLLINNLSVSKTAALYILAVASMFSFLLLDSMLRGNEWNSASKFIIPLFTLFNIYIYAALSKEYGMQRYIFHYMVVSVLISLKILLIFFLFANHILYDYLPIADSELNQSTWIALNSDGIRIFVGQATLIPIGILFYHYLYGKIPYLLLLIALPALVLTQTTVLWVTYVVVLGYLINAQFKSFYKYMYLLLAAISFLMLGILNYDLIDSVYTEKMMYSAPVKFQQIDIALSALEVNFFSGAGLGHLYTNGSNTIEVVFLQILSSTGVIGFVFYSYMLFYWSVVSFKYVKIDKVTKVLFFSYFSIVFASFSNPYLIGGNSGLFLIPIIAARFLQLKRIQLNRFSSS
ncbi:hypothetical protein Rfer_1257 [Rhodoferax ferrireducens T118]|uniref:Uncharacterized protein n=1 Tax=Albidiferax ferrireducens (strain ATCC BAA-621 / DSM 15236 / T118) TaxID=338969 RepID=Q21Z12_ALBFT|nr:hypothetical protein [Rhodoferax ferrireducens]ABD68991.1 hypothetical protein Rfer_1257 [Rhodoferax ferrireducens T118]